LVQGILVLIEPDNSVRDALATLLRGKGWLVECLDSASNLELTINGNDITAVVSEASLPDSSPEQLLKSCAARKLPVIFTGHEISTQGAVDLVRQGAVDFLDKPFPQGRLVDLLNRIADRHNGPA
jgi:DNA-binding NtrC family response regulator